MIARNIFLQCGVGGGKRVYFMSAPADSQSKATKGIPWAWQT